MSVQSRTAESQQIAEQSAPVVSVPIHQIELGYIGRWDAERGDYEPTDEALIFLNGDNEQTCHVEGPSAKAMAAFIVRAVNSHEALVKALEFIRDGYDNQDVNHVDFRVKAYQVALDALASAREAQQ